MVEKTTSNHIRLANGMIALTALLLLSYKALPAVEIVWLIGFWPVPKGFNSLEKQVLFWPALMALLAVLITSIGLLCSFHPPPEVAHLFRYQIAINAAVCVMIFLGSFPRRLLSEQLAKHMEKPISFSNLIFQTIFVGLAIFMFFQENFFPQLMLLFVTWTIYSGFTKTSSFERAQQGTTLFICLVMAVFGGIVLSVCSNAHNLNSVSILGVTIITKIFAMSAFAIAARKPIKATFDLLSIDRYSKNFANEKLHEIRKAQ